MRLVMFEADGRLRLGALHLDQVVDLAAAAAAAAGSAPGPAMASADQLSVDAGPGEAMPGPEPIVLHSVRLLLASGRAGLDTASRAFDFALQQGGEQWLRPLTEVRLRAPIANPRKILALAGNYASHIQEGGGAAPDKSHFTPQVFVKPPTTLIGPDDAIRLPGDLCTAVDYEGELAVVIGASCRAVPVEEALEYVAGYVNYNDVSGRHLNVSTQRDEGPRTGFFDWLNGKWFDTFGPLGPALVTPDELGDPQSLLLQTRVNGEVRQRASTGDMIFSVAETIAWISRFLTLEPGDVIATGTPAGVGSATGTYLRPGDVVEVEIGGLGILRNPVVGPNGEGSPAS